MIYQFHICTSAPTQLLIHVHNTRNLRHTPPGDHRVYAYLMTYGLTKQTYSQDGNVVQLVLTYSVTVAIASAALKMNIACVCTSYITK